MRKLIETSFGRWSFGEKDDQLFVESMDENFTIYRRYIVYQDLWKWYWVEKYQPSDLLGNIAKNCRYFPIYRRYGYKSPIFPNILCHFSLVNVGLGRSTRGCYSQSSKMSFNFVVKGIRTPNKRLNLQVAYHWGKFAPC